MRTKSLGVNKALAAVLTLGELLAAPAAARRERAPVAGKLAAAKRAEIKGRLKEGLSALAARDLTTAAQKIADAYLEAPSPDGLYALAQLALAEGKTLQAQDLMKRYLADPLLEAAPDSAEYQEAERVVALPLPPSALLEIQGTRGTIIKLDGRPVGVLPLAGPVRATPGEHSIDILAGDGELHETVRLSSGRYSELRYNLAPRAFIINVLPGALLLIQAAGLAAPELLLLRAALEGAAQKERYSPLSLPADRAGACQTGESCALASARQLQAEYIVTARAEKNGADWLLAMELLDVEIGSRAALKEINCPACTADKAATQLAALFPQLLKQAVERPRGKLHVVSDPSAAELMIDGRRVGMTPYQGPLFTGQHALALQRRHFHGETAAVEIKEGQTAEAQVRLRDLPEPAPPPPCPVPPPCPACAPPPPPVSLAAAVPRWRLVVGILGISAGVLMIGTGAPAVALDGQCADDSLNVGKLCLNQFQTLPLGAALLGVGSAISLTGTVLLSVPARRADRKKSR